MPSIRFVKHCTIDDCFSVGREPMISPRSFAKYCKQQHDYKNCDMQEKKSCQKLRRNSEYALKSSDFNCHWHYITALGHDLLRILQRNMEQVELQMNLRQTYETLRGKPANYWRQLSTFSLRQRHVVLVFGTENCVGSCVEFFNEMCHNHENMCVKKSPKDLEWMYDSVTEIGQGFFFSGPKVQKSTRFPKVLCGQETLLPGISFASCYQVLRIAKQTFQ